MNSASAPLEIIMCHASTQNKIYCQISEMCGTFMHEASHVVSTVRSISDTVARLDQMLNKSHGWFLNQSNAINWTNKDPTILLN